MIHESKEHLQERAELNWKYHIPTMCLENNMLYEMHCARKNAIKCAV